MTSKIQSLNCASRLSEFFARCLLPTAGVVLLVIGASAAQPAHAGFSITAKPMPAKVAVPAVGKPRLVLSRGMSLKAVITSFVAQYGWSVGWSAEDVFVEEAQSFSGMDHEEVLAAVLRKYQLVADRYPADKGYLINSQSPTGEK